MDKQENSRLREDLFMAASSVIRQNPVLKESFVPVLVIWSEARKGRAFGAAPRRLRGSQASTDPFLPSKLACSFVFLELNILWVSGFF
jgi:hypothetical protein